MEVWVLGTLEVSCDDHPVDVRGALPRRVLALLAQTPGEEVSSDRLIVTDREVEVLALLDEGLRNAEIAQRLYLSEKTVGHHAQRSSPSWVPRRGWRPYVGPGS